MGMMKCDKNICVDNMNSIETSNELDRCEQCKFYYSCDKVLELNDRLVSLEDNGNNE